MTDPKPTDAPETDDAPELDADDLDEEAEPDTIGEPDEEGDEGDELAPEPEGEVAPAAAGVAAGGARRRGVAARPAARVQTPSEVAVHIDDRISAAFVLLVAAVFAAILLWGIFGGRGGVFTPIPTPTPVPSVPASPNASASPAASAPESASPEASVSAPASVSPATSPSPSGS